MQIFVDRGVVANQREAIGVASRLYAGLQCPLAEGPTQA